jgi:glycerophosphodiester phosphodiesterase
VQEKEGIDAVIVDNVLAVRQGLTASPSPLSQHDGAGSVTGSATSGPSTSLTASTDPSLAPSSGASEVSSEAADADAAEVASSGVETGV